LVVKDKSGKRLIPAEVPAYYEWGERTNKIADWPFGRYKWETIRVSGVGLRERIPEASLAEA